MLAAVIARFPSLFHSLFSSPLTCGCPARHSRRGGSLAAVGLLAVFTAFAGFMPAARGAEAPTKIGIIGTGKIGGALARHWAQAGYEVFVSSRHPEELAALVAQLGPKAHAGTPAEAAAFGQVVVVSIPYASMPQLGQELGAALKDKVIIDTANPIERRDGAMALDAQKAGAGVTTARLLDNTHVVRAFNCIPAALLASEANRQPARLAIPIGGDDAAAVRTVQKLVSDVGFDPVVVGSLAQTRLFDLQQPLATGKLTAAEYRALMQQLHLPAGS